MTDRPASSGSDSDIRTVLELGDDSSARPLARWTIRLVAVAVALAGIAGLVVWAMPGGSSGGIRYISEKARVGDLTVAVTATGSVQPTNKVEVSSELSGIVRDVLVDFNSPIKVGQPLAVLDTDRLKATVESSRARLAAAEARVLEAKATVEENRLDYARKKELVARKVISIRDLEIAQAAYDRAVAALASAKAEVGAAKADLKLNETNLAKACICSPIDGVVLTRNVEPGQTVASSFQAPVLFTIAEDLTKMEIQVDVDEADVGKVREGQTATFTVDAYPNRRFKARITELRLGSEVVQGVVTYKAVLTTDNDELLLRPGMTATAEITVARVKDALTVPNAALRFAPPVAEAAEQTGGFLKKLIPGRPAFRAPSKREGGGPNQTVWKMRDGVPAAVPVTVGESDGKRTQILKGDIRAGQTVIVDAVRTKR